MTGTAAVPRGRSTVRWAEYAPPVARTGEPTLRPIEAASLIVLPTAAALGPYASLEPTEGSPYYLFRVLCLVILVPALGSWLAYRHSYSLGPKAFTALVVVWTVWAPAGLLWSEEPLAARNEVIAVSFALAGGFCTLFLSAGRTAALDLLRAGWIGAFLITGGYAVWELATGQHLASNPNLDLYGIRYVSSTFFNPNDYAGFLLACLPFIAGHAIGARSSRRRRMALLLLPLWAYLASATQSRTAILGALLALPVLIYWHSTAAETVRRGARRRLLVYGASTGVLALAAWSSSASRVWKRLRSPLDYDVSIARSDATRLHLTRLGWKFFTESGLVGRGPGTFERAVAADASSNYYQQITNAHNGIIEIAAQYGIVIVAPLLIALWAVIRSAAPQRCDANRGPAVLNQRMSVLLGTMAFIASSLAASSVIACPWWWVLLGNLVAQSWLLHRMREQ